MVIGRLTWMRKTKKRQLSLVTRVYLNLMSCPLVFRMLLQYFMSVVLQGCNDFATAYLDDIMVFSSTLEEHLEHLSIIFGKLRQHNLKLKLKICSFLLLETNYLGFVISEEGIKPDEKKIEAIISLPNPTCVREVRSFIGMFSYYIRFIPNFSQIAEPIIALTTKNMLTLNGLTHIKELLNI